MIEETTLIWLVGLALVSVTVLPSLRRLWREERHTDATELKALDYGLNEPTTLHPVVDPTRCIGTGSCVDVCPETKVLGFRNGQAFAVAPASCIGHGVCERACPMEAIRLVFGTRERGVDLPRVRDDFQTNVPGLYVIGELGGMGLIRNAFEQGRQCIDGIARLAERGEGDVLDLAIVGAGPAGLAASVYAGKAGLRYVTLDREPEPGGTVRHYPRKKLVMTEPVKVPGFGRVGARQIRKEELIFLWDRIVRKAEIPFRGGYTVRSVKRANGCFVVEGDGEPVRARRVVLAIGRRGLPRRLGVDGEELPNVQYALAEPEAFRGDRVLVVGGGDSAVEAALAISEEPDTTVRISYRRDRFSRIKPGNRERIDEAIRTGRVDVRWGTTLASIEQDRVWMAANGDAPTELPNDQVLIFAGGELPTSFLRSCGVEIDTHFGTPR